MLRLVVLRFHVAVQLQSTNTRCVAAPLSGRDRTFSIPLAFRLRQTSLTFAMSSCHSLWDRETASGKHLRCLSKKLCSRASFKVLNFDFSLDKHRRSWIDPRLLPRMVCDVRLNVVKMKIVTFCPELTVFLRKTTTKKTNKLYWRHLTEVHDLMSFLITDDPESGTENAIVFVCFTRDMIWTDSQLRGCWGHVTWVFLQSYKLKIFPGFSSISNTFLAKTYIEIVWLFNFSACM